MKIVEIAHHCMLINVIRMLGSAYSLPSALSIEPLDSTSGTILATNVQQSSAFFVHRKNKLCTHGKFNVLSPDVAEAKKFSTRAFNGIETTEESDKTSSRVGKRDNVAQLFDAQFHFVCPRMGTGGRAFRLYALWDAGLNTLQWLHDDNIGSIQNTIPSPAMEDVYPKDFMAIFKTRVCIQYHDKQCSYDYTGHLEGQISQRTITLQLMGMTTQPEYLRPSVVETCDKTYPDGRVLRSVRPCDITSAEGWTP